MILSNDARRLNPFRMMSSNFEKRDKDYCVRTFQMYVACIGGGLPIQIPIFVY
jgi:hypothetical protein